MKIIRPIAQYLSGRCGTMLLEPPRGTPLRGTVVLVHGVLYRSWVMRFMLGNFLARSGYRVYVYDYRTTRDTVRGHGRRFREFLLTVPGPFAVVTHSMGGLLTRVALAEPLAAVRCVVMIAPPNRGSRAASFWCTVVPGAGRLVRSLPDMRREEEGTTLDLPMPQGVPIGIIGAQFDIQVDQELLQLAQPVPLEICRAGHCMVLRHPRARALILRFLADGHF